MQKYLQWNVKGIAEAFLFMLFQDLHFWTNSTISNLINETLYQCSWDSHKLLISIKNSFWSRLATWIFFLLYEVLMFVEVLSMFQFWNIHEQ